MDIPTAYLERIQTMLPDLLITSARLNSLQLGSYGGREERGRIQLMLMYRNGSEMYMYKTREYYKE